MAPRPELPSGTVTFLFTDVEGSTRLLQELGAERYADALAEHRRVVREAFGAHGGVEVDTQGDAFFVAFPTAPGALAAARAVLAGLEQGPIRLRMGLHTGTPHVGEEGYVGMDVNRAARIAASGHGGQVLVSAATAALVGPDGLRDLGEHRLKDLTAPERVFQLGADDFPPLKTLHQTNLPVPSTPFLGREHELGEVVGLLARPDTRLLTLTGPGGTGKTRLALQAAAAVADQYPHGVWWVPLATLRDHRLVLETAAAALGATGPLAEHVGDRRLLLLLDNFEQVVEAAGDVAGLLAACPNLDVLVTSREPLHVTGEQEYAVPPLAHPEGVGFFLARARAARPDFQADDAVAEICRRLDDLPLALELAAARVKALSSAQILERLERRLPLLTGGARDLPERQRTLRATIEWSHELLAEDEQRLFARLAVFHGGCSLDDAEAVAGADLDVLQSLVDRSLVRHTGERFWMLETIREYAAERLDADPDAAALRRRHAERFLALAEEAEPHVQRASREWRDRLEAEHDNLRAALDWLAAVAETELVLRLAAALVEFWGSRGHLAEGARRLDDALAADRRPTVARARALNAACDLRASGGDPGGARQLAEEALELSEALGSRPEKAMALWMLGYGLAEEHRLDEARTVLEESRELYRQEDDEFSVLAVSRALAWVAQLAGDLERSRDLHEENLRRARAAGNERMVARSLGSLAGVLADLGRFDGVGTMLREAYRMDRGASDEFERVMDLARFSHALVAAGRTAEAAVLLGCYEAHAEELGAAVPWVVEMNAGSLQRIATDLDDGALAEARARGRSLSADEAVELASAALG